jgi:hypothetical protein
MLTSFSLRLEAHFKALLAWPFAVIAQQLRASGRPRNGEREEKQATKARGCAIAAYHLANGVLLQLLYVAVVVSNV